MPPIMPSIDEDCANYLLTALDRSHIGVAICDENYRYQAINSTLARMNGQPIHTHLGRTIHLESAGAQCIARQRYMPPDQSKPQSCRRRRNRAKWNNRRSPRPERLLPDIVLGARISGTAVLNTDTK
jgi:hypothetical protein